MAELIHRAIKSLRREKGSIVQQYIESKSADNKRLNCSEKF
jgi:hypothetical protein